MTINKTAGILLSCNHELLMKKGCALDAAAPGLWGIIEGPAQKQDIMPSRSCLQLIYDETGFFSSDIERLFLRYILFEENGGALNIMYCFEACCKQKKPLRDNSEGFLHWVNKDEILKLPLHPAARLALEHYLSHPLSFNTLSGIVRPTEGSITIEWQRL